jgi:hypothetical protein
VTSTPSERASWNACQNRRCGHRHDQHEPHGRCAAYHCRCRAFVAITAAQYQAGAR